MTLREWLEVRNHRTETGCWEFTGRRDKDGYGRVASRRAGKAEGQSLYGAHRLMYELEVGPIPDGLFLDHLCFNPPCMNPAHLEPVTNSENLLRGSGPTCRNGHDKATWQRGKKWHRYCGKCHADYQRERYHRLRAIPEVGHDGCDVGLARVEAAA